MSIETVRLPASPDRGALQVGAEVGFFEDEVRRRHGTISAFTPGGVRIWVPDNRRPRAGGNRRGYLATLTAYTARLGEIWPEPVIDPGPRASLSANGRDLIAHLSWSRETGAGSAHTAAAHLAAARRILPLAPDGLGCDLTLLDLDALIDEFCHYADELNAATRSQYASNLRRAAAGYLRQHGTTGPGHHRRRLILGDGRHLHVLAPATAPPSEPEASEPTP